jgi:hypothetical protein
MRRLVVVLLFALCAGACSDDGVDVAPTTTGLGDPALRAELLDMMEEDQAGTGDFNARQSRLAEIFDEHGWPGWQLVGEDGSTAAWLIVQHADLDVEFQRRGLALLEDAVAASDASPGDLAYLVDRVRVADGQPQVYGTQWTPDAAGEWQPRTPIEDGANVDARRAEAGLGTIAEYLDELEAMFPVGT